MTNFAEVSNLLVPRLLAQETQRFLRQVGVAGKEGMVLWVGHQEGNLFRVTNILIPKQRGVRTNDGVCVIVDSQEMHRINMELFQTGLRLVAQVHSHPTDAYHSDTDDDHAIANTIGCFSLVVPDFASGEFDLSECAVYRLSKNGSWDHIAPRRVKSVITIE